MTEYFWFYTKLGFWHVIDWEGLDHFYFIITMAIPFTFLQWRKLLWWVTIFTIGHTLSLIGNFYLKISFSAYWIELLIPITIAINSIFLFYPSQNNFSKRKLLYPLLTSVFGIIHGLGFGRYFKMLIPEKDVSISLFSFALGVELAQVLIVILVLLISFIVLKILKQSKNKWEFLIGAMILSQALFMILDRI